MINLDILPGLRRVRAWKRAVPDVVDGAMNVWNRENATDLKQTGYPAKRPGQKYERTGMLANKYASVREKKTTRVVAYSLVNKAHNPGRSEGYASFVVGGPAGSDDQAWFHRGRWYVVRTRVEERIPHLLNITRYALRAKWNELGR